MAGPLVSVITPTLNRRELLEETVRSLAAQTYRNVEHVIVDGGSSDGTQDYLASIASDRLRWVSEPDSGMYDAINKGLALARGEVLGYLNSDDLYLPWAVETVVARLKSEPAADIVYGDAIRIFVAEGRTLTWFQAPIDHDWLVRWGSLIQPAVFWRRGVVDDIGAFNSAFRYAGDLDFWLRAGRRHRFVRADEFLAIDRWHPEAASVTGAARLAQEAADARRRDGTTVLGPTKVAARIRAAVLRRILWLRFVGATRGRGSAWPMTTRSLLPRVTTGDALLGLLPLRPHRGLAAVRWSSDPLTLALGGLPGPRE
jgi:glycosyltransferase involved in cell wall biosynthesis